ncbi:hypothetical protein D3C86_1655500 [compost metagenome]
MQLNRPADTGPAVAHRQHQVVAIERLLAGGAGIARLDHPLQGNLQPTDAAHGIAGIDAQVHQHLLQLHRIDQGRRQPLGQTHLDFHAGWQGGLQQLTEFADQLAQRHRLRLATAAAAEGEHLLDQVAGLFRRVLHSAQITAQALIALLLGQLLGHHRVAEHAGQQVVEIVGDATGQVTYGFHALGLA